MSAPTVIEVRFEAPAHDAVRRPESRRAFADALRARPGEWALLGKHSTAGMMRQAAYQIRWALEANDQAFAPAGSFEAESQTLCGEYRVYVRYVGGGTA
ncbi:hypothetical protein ACH40F_08300 [Streptomyces sp. NPDC020794]|uniref:hypothetical protein n=1 Tax=unclassified Streptomyces TaxID=2593676 RepID=UPI0036EDF1AC